MEEKKKIIVCGGGILHKERFIQEHPISVRHDEIITLQEAREQGIDLHDIDVILVADDRPKQLDGVTVTELMPMFREQNYKDDNKRLKGHERPYRFHR